MKPRVLLLLLLCVTGFLSVNAQDENPFITYDVPSQNLLKYNRFLINPTFSTVREDKSYVNLLHRNQSVTFDDNNQTYFLSYSGRMNDRTGLGLSLYTQREGIVSNYGILANYAYGIKLSDKSNFTFGANLSYYNSGFDQNRANPIENDPLLNGFQDVSLISFQPGFNLSYGKFDFGLFAENLFDYNLKTNESVSDFNEKTYSGHLQYTHQFENASGVMENARLMPLARARKVGQDEFVLGGNLILDLPRLGWVQGGYDSFYGASAGIGFNLNKRVSIGYTMEKGLSNTFDNFGLTHEISFAYSFTPNLTEDRVMLEDSEEALAQNEEEKEALEENLSDKDEEIAELKRRLTENDAILAELMYRQDSLENNRQKDLEDRFERVMRMVRNETNGKRPDLEERAKEEYFLNNDKSALAQQTVDPKEFNKKPVKDSKPEPVLQKEQTRDAVAQVNTKQEKARQPQAASGVKSRKFRDLQGVEDGYYVVANVYKNEHYLNKFVDAMNDEGFPADYIDNPSNGLKYVYLKRYNSWTEAEDAYRTKLGGNYTGDLWIMNVENRYRNDAYVANTNKIKEKSSKFGTDVLQKNVVAQDNIANNDTEEPAYGRSQGITDYYIIANVFANPKNATRFVKLLNSRGLSASYFINPQNKYRYVYIKKHNSWNNALVSYYSKINDAYNDKMWIMRVTPNLIA
ncbi:type IX secretion system membrane protein PorP/SprF [uncultured Muriicola sp.]|uniref:PorP/SprF family type IX secretion system membrane protein n=1 Tax=uncultured Muriicola sp. TaxID=1583102 RepID=UPI00260BF5BF|nr:type IX secretion system membrane protein PorP/SprF [uncultured Muriicola sp.]